MSADGKRLVTWLQVGNTEFLDIFVEGRAARIGFVKDNNQLDRRSPRPHVSTSGRVAWVADHLAYAQPSDSKFFELESSLADPVGECAIANLAPGIAVPAFTPDDVFLVGDHDIKNDTHQLVRYQRRLAKWCQSIESPTMGDLVKLPLANLNPMTNDGLNWTDIYDATISSDGSVVAFTAQENVCVDPLPRDFGATRDLWL